MNQEHKINPKKYSKEDLQIIDIDNLTVFDILKIREKLSLRNKQSSLSVGEKKVFAEVLVGSYDRVTKKIEVINEDIDFLNKDNKQ